MSVNKEQTPQQVGPYELLDTLGSGNFGHVRRARHLHTLQLFAVKIVHKTLLADNAAHEMDIRREMSILRALDHPNIIRLHEVMESDSKIYLVMDLAIGGDFFDLVVRHGRLSEETARMYFTQLVEAVTYCHNRGVFHRDLKPENLLLDGGGRLQVTDFGFGAMKDREGVVLKTSCGSPHYCAPEVWESGRGYDGRKSDAFSVGVVLYVLVVGGQPFNDKCEKEVLRKVARCKVHYPSFLSEEVVDLMKRLLVRDPDKRWDLDTAKTHPWMGGVTFGRAISWTSQEEVETRFVLVGGVGEEQNHHHPLLIL